MHQTSKTDPTGFGVPEAAEVSLNARWNRARTLSVAAMALLFLLMASAVGITRLTWAEGAAREGLAGA